MLVAFLCWGEITALDCELWGKRATIFLPHHPGVDHLEQSFHSMELGKRRELVMAQMSQTLIPRFSRFS